MSDEGIPIPWGAPGDIGPILRFFVHDLIKPLVAQQQNVRSRSNSIASSVDMGHAADDEGSVDGSQNGHDGGDLAPGRYEIPLSHKSSKGAKYRLYSLFIVCLYYETEYSLFFYLSLGKIPVTSLYVRGSLCIA